MRITIPTGQVMADRQVKAVATGNVGSNAFQALNAAGISVITGAAGNVRQAKNVQSMDYSKHRNQQPALRWRMGNKEVMDMPRGQGSGMGTGAGNSGGRGGMRGNRRGGPGGNCVCPKCAEKVFHQQGVPCYSVKCPKCGAAMMRE